MKIRQTEQGSALLIAVIIVIIIGGIGGAFMMETLARGQQQFVSIQMDEAQIICDAAIEKARRDLWYYRDKNLWAWNDILTYCNSTLCIPTSDMDTIWTRWDSERNSILNAGIRNSMSDGTREGVTADGTFTGTYGATNAPPVPSSTTVPATSDTVFLGWCRPFGETGASYHVIVKDNNDEATSNPLIDTDNKLILVVTATLPNGTQKQVEVLVDFQVTTFSPEAGLLSDGTIELGGGQISGDKGRVFSNEAVYANSQTTATQGLSAVTQVYDTNGTAYSGTQTANDSDSGAAPVAITIPDPALVNWLNKTIFPQTNATSVLKLKANGDAVVVNLSSGAESAAPTNRFSQFSYNGANGNNAARWSVDSTGPDTYNNNQIVYVETNFEASTNDNWNLSIISTESIDWTGGGSYNPAAFTQVGTEPVNNIGLIAMKDLRIAGNGTSTRNGLFMAGEQVQLSGTMGVNGSVIAKDKADSSNSLVAPQGAILEGVDVGGSGVSIVFNSMSTNIPLNPASVKVTTLRRINARTIKH